MTEILAAVVLVTMVSAPVAVVLVTMVLAHTHPVLLALVAVVLVTAVLALTPTQTPSPHLTALVVVALVAEEGLALRRTIRPW